MTPTPDRLMTRIRLKCIDCGDCWLWQGPVTEVGLPRYGHGSARRRVWLATHGPIPGKLLVGCNCGQKRCLNPEHLVLRTKSVVMREAVTAATTAKRMHAITKRARAQGKLTMDLARDIRASDETGLALAKRLGVHHSLISLVRHHKAWKEYSTPFAGLGARA